MDESESLISLFYLAQFYVKCVHFNEFIFFDKNSETCFIFRFKCVSISKRKELYRLYSIKQSRFHENKWNEIKYYGMSA